MTPQINIVSAASFDGGSVGLSWLVTSQTCDKVGNVSPNHKFNSSGEAELAALTMALKDAAEQHINYPMWEITVATASKRAAGLLAGAGFRSLDDIHPMFNPTVDELTALRWIMSNVMGRSTKLRVRLADKLHAGSVIARARQDAKIAANSIRILGERKRFAAMAKRRVIA